MAGWFESAWAPGGSVSNNVAFVVNPAGVVPTEYSIYLAAFGFPATVPAEINVAAQNGDTITSDFDGVATSTPGWNHIIAAINTNFVGSPNLVVYVDGVKQTAASIFGNPFSMGVSGEPLYVGDDGTGLFWTGCMADVSLWFGIDLLQGGTDIPSTVRRAFTDTSNNALDPSTAVSLLGKPPVFLTGNAAAFPTNSLGSSGAFTINRGSLTDDCPLPIPSKKVVGSPVRHIGDKRRKVDMGVLRAILRDAGSPWAAELARCDQCFGRLEHLGGDDYYCHACQERIQAAQEQEAEDKYNADRNTASSRLKIPRCIMNAPCDCGELCEDEEKYGWLVGKG